VSLALSIKERENNMRFRNLKSKEVRARYASILIKKLLGSLKKYNKSKPIFISGWQNFRWLILQESTVK